jgi:glycosyltransferase
VESVLSQSYKDVEYILVDGGSTDGTVELLADSQRSASNIRLVSERDRGLYDALNKGVRLATGDVIGFVHADDFLAGPDVLTHVAARFEETGAEALYGDLQYIRENPGGRFAVVRHWRSREYDCRKLKWGWMPPHPALYLKRDVYERAKLDNGEYFDTSFHCAADYDFIIRILSKYAVTPVYLPEVLVKMRTGGVSNRSLKHIIRKSLEDWRVIRRNRIGHVHTLFWKNFGKLGQFLQRNAPSP